MFQQWIFRMELGFRGTDAGVVTRVRDESLMITGDLNMVDVQAVVFYRVLNLDDFVSRVADTEGCPDGVTLRFAAQAALSEVVGQNTMDEVLILKRGEVETDTQALLQQMLDGYGTGIQIENLLLVDVRAPEEVRDAFDDVLRARQERDTLINQALSYENSLLPVGAGGAQRLIIEAEAASDVRLIQAEGDVGRFIPLLRAYASEEIEALKQIHLESLDGILPGIGRFIVAVDTATNSRYPSGSFVARPVSHTVLVTYDSPGTLGDSTRTHWQPLLASAVDPGGPLLLIDLDPVVLIDQELLTLVFDLYARYRVTDPNLFEKAIHPLGRTPFFLGEIITTALAEEVALTFRFRIIGAEPVLDSRGNPVVDAEGLPMVEGTDSRSQFLERTTEAVRAEINRAQPPLGLEVVDIRIKSVGFPDSVTSTIYTRMRAERMRIATKFRAEGDEIAQGIRAQAEASRDVILAEAQVQSDVIIAEGEAAAIDLLIQAVAEEPELSKYQKALEAYELSRGLATD